MRSIRTWNWAMVVTIVVGMIVMIDQSEAGKNSETIEKSVLDLGKKLKDQSLADAVGHAAKECKDTAFRYTNSIDRVRKFVSSIKTTLGVRDRIGLDAKLTKKLARCLREHDSILALGPIIDVEIVDVCRPEHIDLIVSYHKLYIESNWLKLLHIKNKILMRDFFDKYARQVAFTCQSNMLLNVELADTRFDEEDYTRVLPWTHANASSLYQPGTVSHDQSYHYHLAMKLLTRIINVLDLTVFEPNSATSKPSLYVNQKTFDKTRSMTAQCLEFKPYYSHALISVVRLNQLGYTLRIPHWIESQEKVPSMKRWLSITQLCQSLMYVDIKTNEVTPDFGTINKPTEYDEPSIIEHEEETHKGRDEHQMMIDTVVIDAPATDDPKLLLETQSELQSDKRKSPLDEGQVDQSIQQQSSEAENNLNKKLQEHQELALVTLEHKFEDENQHIQSNLADQVNESQPEPPIVAENEHIKKQTPLFGKVYPFPDFLYVDSLPYPKFASNRWARRVRTLLHLLKPSAFVFEIRTLLMYDGVSPKVTKVSDLILSVERALYMDPSFTDRSRFIKITSSLLIGLMYVITVAAVVGVIAFLV